jgi:hypothetical protein
MDIKEQKRKSQVHKSRLTGKKKRKAGRKAKREKLKKPGEVGVGWKKGRPPAGGRVGGEMK